MDSAGSVHSRASWQRECVERAARDIADQERIRQQAVRDNRNTPPPHAAIDLLSLAQSHLLSS